MYLHSNRGVLMNDQFNKILITTIVLLYAYGIAVVLLELWEKFI